MVPQFLSLIEGYSINEVIEIDEKATGRKAVMEYTDRRLGTLARLVASSQKIYEELGWKAEYFVGTSQRKCVWGVSGKGKEDKPPRNKGGL